MVFTACSYLALAGAVWIFLRLFQACFWLPRHLKRQNDVQQMLQDKVDSYEKYILECEARERSDYLEAELETGVENQTCPEKSKHWQERRECLEMLKRELQKVRDGDQSYDWDDLLKEEDDEKDGLTIAEVDEKEAAKKTDKETEAETDRVEKESEAEENEEAESDAEEEEKKDK